MVGMIVSSGRPSSKEIVMTAALTTFFEGKLALANTAGLGRLCIELEPRQPRAEEAALKVNVAVPCLPSADDLKKFNMADDCNAAQIVRESCSDLRALEFGMSLLGEVWRRIREGLVSSKQYRARKKVLLELGASLFSEWGRDAGYLTPEKMTTAASLPLFICDRASYQPRWVDAWVVVKADDWIADIWSEKKIPTRSWAKSLRELCSNKTLWAAVLGFAAGTAAAFVIPQLMSESMPVSMSESMPVSISESMSESMTESMSESMSEFQSQSMVNTESQTSAIIPGDDGCGLSFFRPTENGLWTQQCEDGLAYVERRLTSPQCGGDTCKLFAKLCERFWAGHGVLQPHIGPIPMKLIDLTNNAVVDSDILPRKLDHVILLTDEFDNPSGFALGKKSPPCGVSI
ncbi:hypothetical protein GNI_056230 [Gregarina niphandrodes]|uniref:Uncharacterized protein n=1 Tax=Gregarina niphandrodes TaxID=110365 RepID=A0A023B8W8_GRENI|nr:hypothetical protein GNI_056230 [Gregarina niphandrodes]EZG70300.1 hypothetical protein GNI_056230 [Gregarina niphandrodes]|eukprot:XP_011129962.1 hypothetical protein GNI_056230 [Gregarina niphandrodes]